MRRLERPAPVIGPWQRRWRGGCAALVATCWAALPAVAAAADRPLLRAGQLVDSGAWVRFLGWSADGRRIAWRAGSSASSNVPGQPCLIARLDADGRELDRLRVDEAVGEALVSRRIHSVPAAPRERVTALDVLTRSANGRLWAALGRERLAALLVKDAGGYQPLWRWPLRAVATAVDLTAFDNPQGDLLALVVEVRLGRRSAAALLVMPSAVELGEAATASAADAPPSPQRGAAP